MHKPVCHSNAELRTWVIMQLGGKEIEDLGLIELKDALESVSLPEIVRLLVCPAKSMANCICLLQLYSNYEAMKNEVVRSAGFFKIVMSLPKVLCCFDDDEVTCARFSEPFGVLAKKGTRFGQS